MRKTAIIRLADPTQDRVRPESIAMIAVAAWGAGFVLMLGVARLMPRYSVLDARTAIVARAQLPSSESERTRVVSSTRGMPVGPAEPAHIVKPAPVVENAKPPAAPEPAARETVSPLAHAAGPLAAASGPAASAAAAPPEAAPRPQPTAARPETKPLAAGATASNVKKRAAAPTRVFSKGVLAYLRCEGSERPRARFPCPRDPKFEEAVWRTLAALPRCDTDPGTGTAEVRFLLRKSRVVDVNWKAGTSGQNLDLRAIGKCAGAKLADLRTHLRAPEGLVSFRFSLE